MEPFAYNNIALDSCPDCGGKLCLQVYLSQEGNPVGNVYCMKECSFPTRYFCSKEKMYEVINELNVKIP